MIKRTLIGVVIIAGVLIVGYYATLARTKSHSPAEEVTMTRDGLTVTIRYSRPYKRDRVIFGGLVPHGEVWRTGANEATTFEVNRSIQVAGERLPRGQYALFTIPGRNLWTIIFNEQAKQWGAFDYNPDKDVLRVQVEPETTLEAVEQFTIALDEDGEGITLRLTWDTTSVSIPLRLV